MNNPTPNQGKRLVLTSVNQVLALARNNPILTQTIPKLQALAGMPPSEAPKKSCNCGSKMNWTTPDIGKQQAESILNSLTTEDFIQIKNTLNYNQLCYYKRVADKLEMICV